jgi:hypothetical protein
MRRFGWSRPSEEWPVDPEIEAPAEHPDMPRRRLAGRVRAVLHQLLPEPRDLSIGPSGDRSKPRFRCEARAFRSWLGVRLRLTPAGPFDRGTAGLSR